MPFKNPHPLYSVWIGMHRRCSSPKTKQYADYGGRGISVCERWSGKGGFANFVSDMAPRPTRTSIDRINNDGDYEPTNCRWATPTQQQRNRRMSVYLTFDGTRYLLIELAEKSGLKPDTIKQRHAAGMTLEECLAPVRYVYREGLSLGGRASGAKKQAKTHCVNGHLYDEANTARTPKGARYCKACKNIKQKERTRRLALVRSQQACSVARHAHTSK